MKRRPHLARPVALVTLLALGLLALLLPGQWVRDPVQAATPGLNAGGPASRTVDAADTQDGILPGLKKWHAEQRQSFAGAGGKPLAARAALWTSIGHDRLGALWPASADRILPEAGSRDHGATGPPVRLRA